MAADLAAAYIVDFIGVLAPQVGLEPTTLRLTVEDLPFSALLIIVIFYILSARYDDCDLPSGCGYYPHLGTILKQSTHKSPHSVS
jgi:hypothetical protein